MPGNIGHGESGTFWVTTVGYTLQGENKGQYKTWTLDSGLDFGLDSGLNGLDIWTRILIARGQRSFQISQQHCLDVSLCNELIISMLLR